MDASIVLYSGSNIISWVIKKLTKTPISHVAWINADHEIIEAELFGVETNPWTEYPVERIALLKLNLPDDVIERMQEFAKSQVGQPYDFKLFFGLWWRLLWGWSRKKAIPNWPTGYICSELVARPLHQIAGLTLSSDVDPANITPGDIWKWAKANPDMVEFTWVGSKIQ